MCLLSQRRRRAKGQAGWVDYFLEVPLVGWVVENPHLVGTSSILLGYETQPTNYRMTEATSLFIIRCWTFGVQRSSFFLHQIHSAVFPGLF